MLKSFILTNLIFLFCCATPSFVLANPDPLWYPGQYIVKYSATEIQNLKAEPDLSKYSEEVIENALTEILAADTIEILPLIEASTIEADNKIELDIDVAVDLIQADLIEYISPNFIRKISNVPNDPQYASLWGMSQSNDIDINGPQAAEKASFSETENIVVGIVDTGIDYTHPDLIDNIWKNPAELNGVPGVDDDGNGVIDDIYGYNAITNSGDPFDDNKHGTHCAGTIGARGDNGIGVAGVVWKVKLMGLKFLDSQGRGSDSAAIKAISYAISMRNRGGQLKVLSNSWGGGGYNPALLNVIKLAEESGILFVAAAGNENTNTDVTANYPSCYDAPNVLAVGAINSSGTRASFSNYGAHTVDIAAPGVGILSTVPGNGYEYLNGTSMATPHVSGLAVLAYAQSSMVTAVEVKNIIMQSTKPLNALNGLMVKAGIPNAAIIASDSTNYAPNLLPITRQFINPKIKKLAVPLVAFDIEKEPITFSAEIFSENQLSAAAKLDQEYKFDSFLSTVYDYYWKLITAANNRIFLIRFDGALFEMVSGTYTLISTLGVEYYNDPNLLISAFVEKPTRVNLEIKSGTPSYLEITALNEFTEPLIISATASDGNKSDIKHFTLEMQDARSCQ